MQWIRTQSYLNHFHLTHQRSWQSSGKCHPEESLYLMADLPAVLYLLFSCGSTLNNRLSTQKDVLLCNNIQQVFHSYCIYSDLHFVLACRYVCKKALSETDIVIADSLLLRFCSRTEQLYGTSVITPNMHMHGHLSECIRDYGPLHTFWLFSFERYNGLLGIQPNNNRSIEMQLIKRFVDDNEHLELLSDAKNIDHADVFYDIVAGHAQEFLSVVGGH